MFSTQELEKYIVEKVSCRIENVNWENIFFQRIAPGSPEGIYIFSVNGEYHVSFAEKGKIKENLITTYAEEVLWQVVKCLSFSISFKYAVENREDGKDFRRMLFKKDLEVFFEFGENFGKRRKAEIEKILKENPYADTF